MRGNLEPIRLRRTAEISRYPQLGVIGALGVAIGDTFVGGEVSGGSPWPDTDEDVDTAA